MKRRDFLGSCGAVLGAAAGIKGAAVLAQGQREASLAAGSAILIDPAPRFELSPHLYMQFMEPLGVT
ncbi:MAG TPA: alpha-L-arabinofuranosidase, partial [Verrucomicrobiae bacterium]|nr:alpha-L-arabinofuranosidase [Verrucomicrobiae bacterium]